MQPLQEKSVRTPELAPLAAFAEHVTAVLNKDDRVRVAWLTGSLATGTADAYSDLDLRVAVLSEDFARIGEWWDTLIDSISPTVWKRRWPGPPDEAIISAITTAYMRFDLVLQSVADTRPRNLQAVRVLFDKDGVAEQITLTAPARINPLAKLSFIVEEFIRLLGTLTIVVGRDDLPIALEGQLGCHSLLISLLLMENGIDRMAMGKRHVAAFLTEEQRTALASIPALAPTLASVVEGRLAYARLFLPRARRLMEANGFTYPEAFEVATLRHLKDELGVDL